MKAVQSVHLLLLCSAIAFTVVQTFLRTPRHFCFNSRATCFLSGRNELRKLFATTHSDAGPSNEASEDNSEDTAPEHSPKFSVDIFGDIDSTDEDLLAVMREKKVLANDAWQSRLFRDNQAGHWEGIYDILVPRLNPDDGALYLEKFQRGTVRTDISAASDTTSDTSDPSSPREVDRFICSEIYTTLSRSSTQQNDVQANLIGNEALRATVTEIVSSQWRPSNGNQCVGNAYTLCRISNAEAATAKLDDVHNGNVMSVFEIGLREQSLRTRVRFLYAQRETSQAVSANEPYEYGLVALTVLREHGKADTTLRAEDAEQQEKDPRALFDLDQLGLGIYDPQVTGEPYVEVPLPGKLTLLFPRGLRSSSSSLGDASAGLVSMEWVGSQMRYQVDRVLGATLSSPALKTLELTEVTIENAAKYPALFPKRPEFLQ